MGGACGGSGGGGLAGAQKVRRRHARQLLEGLGKVRCGGKADLQRDLRDREVGGLQQRFGAVDAYFFEVGEGRAPDDLFEAAFQVIFVDVKLPRQHIERHRFRVILFHVLLRQPNDAVGMVGRHRPFRLDIVQLRKAQDKDEQFVDDAQNRVFPKESFAADLLLDPFEKVFDLVPMLQKVVDIAVGKDRFRVLGGKIDPVQRDDDVFERLAGRGQRYFRMRYIGVRDHDVSFGERALLPVVDKGPASVRHE